MVRLNFDAIRQSPAYREQAKHIADNGALAWLVLMTATNSELYAFVEK